MNEGTHLRTALVIATCLNTALIATDVTQFENPTVNLIYRIVSVILNFIIVALATYYNNDYTNAGEIGTVITRKIKEDPTLIVEVIDGDDVDDEDDDEDDPGEYDETIEEGEADEVEQK